MQHFGKLIQGKDLLITLMINLKIFLSGWLPLIQMKDQT
jgi:hypothetical protein